MQDELIKKLFQQDYNCKEIQKELKIHFGEDAYKQRTIYKHLEKVRLDLPLRKQPYPLENRYDFQIIKRVQEEVNKSPFFSVRSLAHKLNLPSSLIHRYLTELIEF